MRKVIIVLIFIAIVLYFPFKTQVDNFVKENILYKFIRYEGNEYFVNKDFGDFNYYNELVVYNRKDVLDIFYTFINRGTEEFHFYCDPNYFGCKQDIITLIDEKDELLYINDFVHTFNMFDGIKMDIDGKKIHFNTEKNYSYEESKTLEVEIKRIISEFTTDSMSIEEKIKFLHNYIILNVEYDEKYAYDIKHGIENNSLSYKASGALFDKKAVCSGYTDLMALFLSYLNVPNIKVSTKTHVWNAVYLDNKWYHIDVTNDDIGNNISYEYFMLDSNEIHHDEYHNYSKIIYPFL